MAASDRSVNLRVLVVDDHDISRRFTIAALRQTAHPVKQARSGCEAISVALEFKPQLVFMDLHLGDMHGLDAIAAIRDRWRARQPAPRFIVLSADESEHTRRRLEAFGLQHILKKPVRRHELKAAMLGSVAEKAGRSAPSSPDPALHRLLTRELSDGLALLDRHVAALDWSGATADMHRLIATAAMCALPGLESALRELSLACSKNAAADSIAAAYCKVLETADGVTTT
ncbi:MAG: response regulator [Xanthomonadales bacterium]|nr:response regulator [Xanthomonadales bacterium]